MFNDITKVLLITDMDGTFLPDNKIPSATDLDAVTRFQAAGGTFSVATGRAVQAARQYFKTVRVNSPVILSNGGMVYDQAADKILHSVFLPGIADAVMRELLAKFPDTGCEVLTGKEVFVTQFNDIEREHNVICNVIPVEISPEECETRAPEKFKILFAAAPETVLAMAEYVKDKPYLDAVDFVISAPVYFEMLPKHISKGAALEALRGLCGMEDYTICAVGDYFNDIEMLRYADVAFCPANAVDEVKAVCDVVLPYTNEENAVAAVVSYIFTQCGK
ncbi:MAG: HAD-IIB family hydrolase [Oscillospiraceae bacterium]